MLSAMTVLALVLDLGTVLVVKVLTGTLLWHHW
jgi:hypothetical protein